MACALIANAASFVLPIANPANLVVFGRTLPPLAPWMRIFLIPSILSVLLTFFCLRILSNKDLRGLMNSKADGLWLSTDGLIVLLAICVAAVVLLIASADGIPLGAPTCATGLLALLFISLRNRRAWKPVLGSVSWSVLPLLAGLFMIVAALNRAGMLRLTQSDLEWLAHTPDGYGKFITAFAVAGLSNLMNNLPVGLASGSALQQMHSSTVLTHAALVGIDLGPNLSVTGSLATILWLIALRREGAEITPWEFLRIGAFVMPISLAIVILALLDRRCVQIWGLFQRTSLRQRCVPPAMLRSLLSTFCSRASHRSRKAREHIRVPRLCFGIVFPADCDSILHCRSGRSGNDNSVLCRFLPQPLEKRVRDSAERQPEFQGHLRCSQSQRPIPWRVPGTLALRPTWRLQTEKLLF
jgi:hypothetical protein